MTSFETRFWLILGIVAVGAFAFVADDLNDLFHQRRAVDAPGYAEAVPKRPVDGYLADRAARPSNVVARDQSPVSGGRDIGAHSARGVSQAELLDRALSPDRSPVETGRQETAPKAGPAV